MGSGSLTLEVLDPEDLVVERAERHVEVAEGTGQWQEDIRLGKPLALDELVWHRLRYRFEYGDKRDAVLEGTESISQNLRRTVVQLLSKQYYLNAGPAAARGN